MNRTRTVRWLRVLLPLLALAMLSTLFLFSRGSDGESQIPYADVDADNDRFIIRNDYSAPGMASSAGTYSLNLFGPRAAADMREGRTLIIRDVQNELAPGEGPEMFQAIGIGARRGHGPILHHRPAADKRRFRL